jgi:uncharacterized protein YjbI with pentapeptide repeats
METHHSHLWYVRRDGDVRGPFPAGQISREILLGRIVTSDELSQDQLIWYRYPELPNLIPDVMRNVKTDADRQRLELARLREDERTGQSRRDHDDLEVPQDRRHGDRRAFESLDAQDFQLRRTQHAAESAWTEDRNRDYTLLAGLILLLIFMAVVAFFWFRPATDKAGGPDCGARAASGVNWSYCQKKNIDLVRADLRGANLANSGLTGVRLNFAQLGGANLSYGNFTNSDFALANLEKANLMGAVLRGAKLDGANLREADLSYADLSGASVNNADFVDANLSRALWVDGRTCEQGSIGFCR